MPRKNKPRVDYWVDDYEVQPEPEDKLPTKSNFKLEMTAILSKEEVNQLLSASSEPLPQELEKVNNLNYPTYSEYEVVALIHNNYKPKKTKRKK